MGRYQKLQDSIGKLGWTCDDYAPGDGKRRIRFFPPGVTSGYFGPHSGAFTALGLAEAETFAAGLAQGHAHFGGNTEK